MSGFIWYELMTTDVASAREFYEAVVGWSISAGSAETNGYGFIANADGAMTGGIMQLTPAMRAHGARSCWLGYIQVPDCDAAVKAIVAMGGKCLMPPTDVPMAGRMAMAADCCGAPFYVMTPTPPPGSGESTAFSPSLEGRCTWNELRAGNIAAALDFYTSLFGWELPEPLDMGPLGKYNYFSDGGVTLGAMMQQVPGESGAYWNHYFRVASIFRAARVGAELGGTVIMEPHEVPGGDWVMQLRDPQGAICSLAGAKGD